MKINHEDLIGSFEQKKALVNQFTLFEDIFFSAVMKDKAAAEYVLRLCTGIPTLKLVSSNIQQSLRNMFGKSSVLDFIAQDSTGALINIEVQNSDDDEYFGPKRARYYQSMIDASFVPKGITYNKLPEVYIIFITPFNPLKEYGHHKVAYRKVSYLEDVDWGNDVQEIYLNAEETDNSELSAMLQYFRTADPQDERFGALSAAVRNQKGNETEVNNMCKAVEDYAKERERIALEKASKEKEEAVAMNSVQFVDALLNDGYTLEKALKMAGIDEETYNKYKTV